MKKESIAKVRSECQRVLAAIKAVDAHENQFQFFVGTKESGALKRASMDLTRALAEMRRY